MSYEHPTTPVKRTGEPNEYLADGRLITYYVDTQHTRWACIASSDGFCTYWRKAPKEGAK